MARVADESAGKNQDLAFSTNPLLRICLYLTFKTTQKGSATPPVSVDILMSTHEAEVQHADVRGLEWEPRRAVY